MNTLVEELEAYKNVLSAADKVKLNDALADKLYEVYPFNKFEYTISYLIAKGIFSFDEYLRIRSQYRARNKYLYLFELAPRTFGETWGQRHLMELVEEFEIPSKDLDSGYSGQYDLFLEGIRVEVKASRAVNKKGGDSLPNKALASNSQSKFDMNFQQLKPSCCDVFVWIAVWRDRIDYWVFPSKVLQEPHDGNYFQTVHLSPQHRKEGPVPACENDIFEGQIHINERNYAEFDPYRVFARDIYGRIKTIMGK
ncbi:hypothetical protein MR642_07560 [bacterium]|nr:hypothetical protein [bacterium]